MPKYFYHPESDSYCEFSDEDLAKEEINPSFDFALCTEITLEEYIAAGYVPSTPVEAVKYSEEEWNQWVELKAQLPKVRDDEMELRKKIAATHYPGTPVGTNTHLFPEDDPRYGKRLVVKYSESYKVDVASAQLIVPRLAEVGITNINDYLDWKPELKKTEYKKLTPEQKAIFDECLTITIGSPTVEFEDIPKGRGRK